MSIESGANADRAPSIRIRRTRLCAGLALVGGAWCGGRPTGRISGDDFIWCLSWADPLVAEWLADPLWDGETPLATICIVRHYRNSGGGRPIPGAQPPRRSRRESWAQCRSDGVPALCTASVRERTSGSFSV